MALFSGRSYRLLKRSVVLAKLTLDNPLPLSHIIQSQSMVSRKLVYSEYGDPAVVVRHEEEQLPKPKSNEVVVRMLASPVNPADINTIQGVYPIKPSLPAVPGNEGVGVVEAVGPEVKNLEEGDRVLPKKNAWGTWRSHAICDSCDLIKISKNIGIVEAATLAVNPCTAYRMLKDFVQLKPGDTVIQNGANSAAGQNVIQMCKAWEINTVNIVRNRESIDKLKCYLTEMGATHVLTEEEMRSAQLYKGGNLPKPKLALNCIGGKNALEMIRHLDHGGVMVTYGGMSKEPVTVPTSLFIFKDIKVHGFWMTRWSTKHENSPERITMLEDIIQMICNGKLKPPAYKLVAFNNYKEALVNTLSPKGYAGVKYVLDFQEC